MSEEEIIEYIKDEIENETDTFHWFDNIPENKTRKQIEESINAHQGLLNLYNKEKEKNKELEKYKKYYETEKVVWSRKDYISKDKIIEILGLEENDDTTEKGILDYIDILVSENARLEDIEDRKVQIEYQNVFNKGVKSVGDKIKEKTFYYLKQALDIESFNLFRKNTEKEKAEIKWYRDVAEVLKQLLVEGDKKNNNKLDKVKKFLKEHFDKPIQAFTTRNLVGDYMYTIYDENGITIDYAPGYGYIEIFGITEKEFKELEKERIIY